jgi:hypothetical protein
MSDIIAEVLSILPNAEKLGVLSNDEKGRIKEIVFDEGNMIVLDILNEYASTKNQSKLLNDLKEYIHSIESDDEDKNYVDIGASPTLEGFKAPPRKKPKSTNKIVEQIGISECEEGMSPKVVFDKK